MLQNTCGHTLCAVSCSVLARTEMRLLLGTGQNARVGAGKSSTNGAVEGVYSVN